MKRQWIGGSCLLAAVFFWFAVVRQGEAQLQVLMTSFMGQMALSTAEGQAAVHHLTVQRAVAFGLATIGAALWAWGWRARARDLKR